MSKFKRMISGLLDGSGFGVATGKRDVDLSGSNNLFGTLGQGAFPILTRMGFIPNGTNGEVINIADGGDNNSPRWIGLDSKQMQFWAYVYCSPLAAVIDRLAECDSNGVIKFVDEDNAVPIKNVNKIPKLKRIKDLLKNPNPWQTQEEFEAEQVEICKVFGYCPVFAIGGLEDRSYTKALVNINPIYATPVANPDFTLFGTESRIKQWNLTIQGHTYNIPSKDIILMKDGYLSKGIDELGLPLSKIHGMDFFVSNICAAMEADNVLLKRKGPLGVWSYDPGKDMAGSTPLIPAHADELQASLARYGLTIGQLQHIISKMPIKWNATSFNLRDLMTKETIRAGIDGICDRFGYPAELMSGKNATYENRSSAEKYLYQNNVIPFSLRRMTKYNEFFELDGVLIIKDYDHLAVLQEDIVKAGEAAKYEAEGLDIEWKAGMITWNQWQTAKGRDSVAGMDIYFPDYIKTNPEMNPNKSAEKPQTKNKDGKKAASKDTGTKK